MTKQFEIFWPPTVQFTHDTHTYTMLRPKQKRERRILSLWNRYSRVWGMLAGNCQQGVQCCFLVLTAWLHIFGGRLRQRDPCPTASIILSTNVASQLMQKSRSQSRPSQSRLSQIRRSPLRSKNRCTLWILSLPSPAAAARCASHIPRLPMQILSIQTQRTRGCCHQARG